MENKTCYFIILFLLTSKIYGQDTIYIQDTVFVYDKIVYDTIKVYDTLKVEDKNFTTTENPDNFLKKNNTIQNAVLAIDTTTSKGELILFNQKDTATISISNIILSENLNNSENMKKEILTLAAAALLIQPISAQNTQESITAPPVPAKNMVTGLGVSSFGFARGGNFKLNYLLTNKFSLGIQEIVTFNNLNYTNPATETELAYSVDTEFGMIASMMIATNYYIFGKNQLDGKGGIYAISSVGYTGWFISETITTLVPMSDPRYYKYSVSFKSENFSVQFGLGADRKLGRGRIYLEALIQSFNKGKDVYKFHDVKGGNNIPDSKSSRHDYFLNGLILFNLGYQL